VVGSLAEKRSGDSIIQPAPLGAEENFISNKFYTKNRPTITVSSGGSVATGLMQETLMN
jgi:hypothetical protein